MVVAAMAELVVVVAEPLTMFRDLAPAKETAAVVDKHSIKVAQHQTVTVMQDLVVTVAQTQVVVVVTAAHITVRVDLALLS
jgi:hypothetical protein